MLSAILYQNNIIDAVIHCKIDKSPKQTHNGSSMQERI